MGDVFETLNDEITKLICAQPMFFVATAPSGSEGHVNVSPKGYDSFRVLGPDRVAYLDITGSGVETIAHLRENGRITLMFCRFEGPPKIVRIYGQGQVLLPDAPEFAALRPQFPEEAGVRSIITVSISRVATSCGYAVPLMQFESERDVLRKYAEKKGPSGLDAYRRKKNVSSIDGLPGLDFDEV